MSRLHWIALSLCLAAPGGVAPAQETSPKLELLGHLPLRGPRGDVWAHKTTAYVGNWGDTTGVAIIDIADPKNPTLIGNLPTKSGASYEDIHVISADTVAFKGDLLAVGVQRSTGGVEFWDVSDPRAPKLLSYHTTGSSHVHELYLMQRGDRILALLATVFGGMRIVDATDPANPQRLSSWTAPASLNTPLGVDPNVLCHSVSASADGMRAYLSYWDAGAVILDISDPAKPQYLGRAAYPLTEEGNTHSAVEADGGRLLITTDEEAHPEPAAHLITVTAPASLAGLHYAMELSVTRQLADTGPVRGELVYVGRATIGTDLLSDPKGKVALIDIPGNSNQPLDRILRAQEAGAIAVVVNNILFRDTAPDAGLTIPGVGVIVQTASKLKGALAKGEKVEVELRAAPASFGFLRLWDIRDPAKPVQIGDFATPATRQFPVASGNRFPWAHSVHNPVARGTRLYASWYADGVRVLDIADPTKPKEIAHFVPPFIDGSRLTPGRGSPFAAVWGVVEHNGLLLLSDMQTGLWIVRDLPR